MSNGLAARRRIIPVAGLLLLTAAMPAWSAGLQLPSTHSLTPAKRIAHPQLLPAKPVIVGANYHLAASCTNPLHAISVTVRLRDQGGPLEAGQARIQISDPSQHPSAIWNANSSASLLPALAPGQVYTTKQWVGALPAYRKALPGRHTLLIEVVPQQTDRPGATNSVAHAMYRLPVSIPAGYCQPTLRPDTKGAALRRPGIRGATPNYPPSPCLTKDCAPSHREVVKSPAQLKRNKASNFAEFGSALKPDLHVVSVKVSPQRSVTGTPILVTAIVQNKGGTASAAGTVLHIYCNAYGNSNTPPTSWTCKVPAPHTSAGGMPMWDIPLPAVRGHGQADVALRINEHWPEGMYYFTHVEPGKSASIQDLVKAKTDSIIEIDAK
ncbi:MAG: hypothetical protein P8090_14100 [Gammaproteobacteria bacterium]